MEETLMIENTELINKLEVVVANKGFFTLEDIQGILNLSRDMAIYRLNDLKINHLIDRVPDSFFPVKFYIVDCFVEEIDLSPTKNGKVNIALSV